MKPPNPETRRDKPVITYVCKSERVAVDKLGTHYTSVADAVRQALALLIATRHPELQNLLRKDLTSTL